MDEVVFGVGPVELLLAVVHRQPVGPLDVLIHDHRAGGTVHPGPLDLWDLPPVRPVHEPGNGDGAEATAEPSLTPEGGALQPEPAAEHRSNRTHPGIWFKANTEPFTRTWRVSRTRQLELRITKKFMLFKNVYYSDVI